MFIRFALFVSALAAQPTTSPSPAPPTQAADGVRVRLETDLGPITIEVDRRRAPITAANFLRYVDGGRYDGESFYRALSYGEGGLVQAGISDGRKLYPPIAHEPSASTGLNHVAGAVSMANAGPGTAQSDFFILTSDTDQFDAEFAVFGRVVEGMDVVRKILASPVSPTKGADNGMQGQMLEPAVKILDAERVGD